MVDLKKRNCLLKQKLLYTFFIICTYLLGKAVPLYMIDISAYYRKQVDAETLLLRSISGDVYQCSLFALGISPYIISSVIVFVLSAFKRPEVRKKTSPAKNDRLIIKGSLFLSIFMAVIQVQGLYFCVEGTMLTVAKTVAVIELVAGAMLIIYMVTKNKKYGVGGQSALIFVNILDGLIVTLQEYELKQWLIPLLISFVVIVVMIIMENAEKRIPVQRISIHNIYADKNYLAIKLNPIGVMPVMFSMAIFLLLRMLLAFLELLIPENANLVWFQENLELSRPVGIVIYVLIIYIMTIGFSRVFINPKELTEQFLKSGDSIQDLHAGKDTKKYLSKSIAGISFVSATVMSICLSVPMYLQMEGKLDNNLSTLPTTVMMLTGIWSNLYREVMAIRDLEAYEPFI